jgi:hypothetical protein
MKCFLRLFLAAGVVFPAASAHALVVARWDANNLSLADGAPVSAWASSVGGFTVTAAAGAEPLFAAGGISGRPSVDFDGVNDVLKLGSSISGVQTVVGVAIIDTGAVSLVGLVSTGGDRLNVRRNNTTNFYRSDGQLGDNNDFYRADGVVDGEDGVYVNDIKSGSFTFDVPHVVLSETDDGGQVYTDFWIGNARDTLTRYWNGDIGEIILFDNALTPDERTGVAHNLGVKWGFGSDIPATQSQIQAANALGVVIPEPGGWLLLTVGAGGVLGRRRAR